MQSFDRRFAFAGALLLSLPAAGSAAEVTDAFTPRARRAQLAAQANTGAGQVMNSAVSVSALLTAMDIDPSIVVSPSLTGDGRQSAVFPSLGQLVPSQGPNFAFLSTGVAGAGTSQSADPTVYGVQAGTDTNAPCSNGVSNANDCVSVKFSFNVPAGMHSIAFDFNFMSAEYPEWVGDLYNDAFTVRLQSPTYNYPNIAIDAMGNPVTINSAFFNQPCTSLIGSGFDIYDFGGGCDAGATGMLTSQAPVEPGETVTITFELYDIFDGMWDSAVLLDNFLISEEEVDGPTTSGQVVIDYLSPKSGPLAGGTSTIIHGEGFVNVAAVSFGGVPALYQILDEFTIQAVTPPHSEGPVDVAVTAQPGSSVSTGVRPGAFIYYVSPEGSPLQVISVDPPEGPSEGGVAVAVRGSGFKGDTVITFDGEPVESQQFINGDEIIIVTPNGSGAADIRAVNPDGTDAELPDGYLYIGNGAGGAGTNNFTKGCSCSLSSTSNPASGAAAPLAIAGLVLAAWLVRRRAFEIKLKKAAWAASVPVAFFTMGCNDQSLAPVNSAPIADAGPSAEAFVGDEITLDGTGSRDFEDGNNLEFAWEIVSKPDGSAAVLDDPSEKTPSFLADLPGLYRIGLVVTDSDLIESGPIGYGGTDDDNLTDIVVLPFRDLSVTLSWDTADSDLDLHLIRPNASLNGGYWNPDYDCFYGAPDPEWGVTGIEADNPLLGVDVDTGMGPEEISLASPQDNGTYRILVHVFNMHGAPAADATVTVSVEGSVIAEVVSSAPLGSTDQVWKVGTIAWPDNVFNEDNTFTTHGALGGPAH